VTPRATTKTIRKFSIRSGIGYWLLEISYSLLGSIITHRKRALSGPAEQAEALPNVHKYTQGDLSHETQATARGGVPLRRQNHSKY